MSAAGWGAAEADIGRVGAVEALVVDENRLFWWPDRFRATQER